MSFVLAMLLSNAARLFAGAPPKTDPAADRRNEMVRSQIERRGVKDARVLNALRRIPRHLFVPEEMRSSSYDDEALPIGAGQTISQPYVVAAMTERLRLTGEERVLEIGTGSGYQAAVLAELAAQVYSVEIIPELADRARKTLSSLNYSNVHVRTGDGGKGWPEKAPFDAVIVTAAPEDVPPALLEQLKMGGRLVIPVGPRENQDLVCFHKTPDGVRKEILFPVRFVPFVRGE
ncbi:MAG TPA: protein-L-isoaspartate(D-aspartate) O-methyltransferase [Elusimicrobiota bacterium]|nr:protein-L-isoaspartate(D-aspartate) O-methyltransferase [Elusimicrobiota bacterium]